MTELENIEPVELTDGTLLETALIPPPADAPAAEWGAFAVSIPGWCFPESCPLPGFVRRVLPSDGWMRTNYVDSWVWSGSEVVPDPDHWAWEGWLLRLLGPGWCWQHDEDGWEMWGQVGGRFFRAPTLGRACIAAAAALGRWPGGAE